MTKDLVVKPMTNNQYLQAILTAESRYYCLQWRWDFMIEEEPVKDCNTGIKIETSNII